MKHGKTGTRLYRIWANMKQRCYNPNTKCYKYYGKRGITICDEWRNNFTAFYEWAMANGYQDPPEEWCKYKKFVDGLSIDRIDGNKGYSPENCRWVTMEENWDNNKYHEAFMEKVKLIEEKREKKYRNFQKRLSALREKQGNQEQRRSS